MSDAPCQTMSVSCQYFKDLRSLKVSNRDTKLLSGVFRKLLISNNFAGVAQLVEH
jgi:hypothetical protein